MTRPDPFAPVIGLDIDGTSGDHHGWFIKFAEMWLGRELPTVDEYAGDVQFHKHLGISRSTYNTIKLAYRQGGMKRSMPVYAGIGEFTRYVRSKGVQVWICTTRPYLNLSNIDPDTRHWVQKRAKMQFDAVLYGPHKYRDLVKAVGSERVVCVYDDLPKMIEQARSVGVPAYMRAQPYNASSGIEPVVRTVLDMAVAFDAELKRWKEAHGR